MNSIKFVKRLKDDQIKALILLSFAEYDIEKVPYNITSPEEIEVLSKISENNIKLDIYNTQQEHYLCSFQLNDFIMFINDGDYKHNLSHILKLYLTHEFGYEYAEHLYSTRLKVASIEKQKLLKESPNILKKYNLESLNKPKQKLFKRQ